MKMTPKQFLAHLQSFKSVMGVVKALRRAGIKNCGWTCTTCPMHEYALHKMALPNTTIGKSTIRINDLYLQLPIIIQQFIGQYDYHKWPEFEKKA